MGDDTNPNAKKPDESDETSVYSDGQEAELKAMAAMLKAISELSEKFIQAATGAVTSALGPMGDMDSTNNASLDNYSQGADKHNESQSSPDPKQVADLATKIAPMVI